MGVSAMREQGWAQTNNTLIARAALLIALLSTTFVAQTTPPIAQATPNPTPTSTPVPKPASKPKLTRAKALPKLMEAELAEGRALQSPRAF